jgi:hypothetical protein
MSYDPYQNSGAGPYGPPQPEAQYVITSPAAPFLPADQYFGTPAPADLAPPPPPKRPNVPLIIVSTVLVTVVVGVVAFCGLSFFGVALIGATADASPSASPTPTTSASAHPSSSASVAPARQLVQPAGAPYSYRVPVGFHPRQPPAADSSPGPSASTDPDPAPREMYRTTATTQTGSANDFVSVASFTLKQPASAANETALGAQFDRWVKAAGADPSTRVDVRVGNYPAFKYTFTNGAIGAYDYFVFNGRTAVDVVCEWSADQAAIQHGCQELLNTLMITA